MRAVCIDPGNHESGWVVIETDLGLKGKPGNHGKYRNSDLRQLLQTTETIKVMVIEKPVAQGMARQEVIDTADECGSLKQICRDRGIQIVELTRSEVKTMLVGAVANDAQVRDAVARHWGVEVVNKRLTGILKGFVKDEIQALGLGLAWMKQQGIN